MDAGPGIGLTSYDCAGCVKQSDGTRVATIRSCRWLIESHLKPLLGRHRLDKLTPEHVRGLVTAKSNSDPAPATVAHILSLLRNGMGEAERLDLVPRNVAKAVRMPKVPRYQAEALDVAGARRLIAALAGHRLDPFMTTLVLGLRRGEALGLSWEDVDLEAGTVRVRQSLQRLEGSLRLVPTKTRRSNATLAALRGLMEVLRQHRRRQQEERLARGAAWPGFGPGVHVQEGDALGASEPVKGLGGQEGAGRAAGPSAA